MTAEKEVLQRIADRGAITFCEFMDVALYWPGGGYYMAPGDRTGAHGDFYTSPLVHPAFGALLSVQLFQMWQLMDRPNPFTVVEMGAGNGLLSRDLAGYSKNLPEGFPQALRYVCLDISPRPALEQVLSKSGEYPEVIRIAAAGPGREGMMPPGGIPLKDFHGCVLSNELLDAIPVNQVTMRQGKLLEVYVTVEHGELALINDEPSTPKLADRLNGLGIALDQGQTAEISLGLTDWARMVSDVLESGYVLTVDYGRMSGDLYSNTDRHRGTLTSFYRHTQTDAPLRRIGSQDITAQVDFTSVMNEGRKLGLEPLGYSTQREFLLNLGLQEWQRSLTGLGLSQSRTDGNRAGMVDLVRPGGLGDFKVLVQGKGVGSPLLWGFEAGSDPRELRALMASMPAPLMTPDHLNLNSLRGSVPEFELEGHWPPFPVQSGEQEGSL